jgi:hypothetical protein
MRSTKGSPRARTLIAFAGLLALPFAAASAQDTAASTAATTASAADDALFGAETVTETKTNDTATPQNDFLKYEQVKVGGRITGSVGYSGTWLDPWNVTIDPLNPDATAVAPSLSGRLQITAKPSTDFGVNMELRSSWPFLDTTSVLTGAQYGYINLITGQAQATMNPIIAPKLGVATTSASISVPDIHVWSLYSRFSWKDALFFSFGKQPLSWGVSKSFFQPADDIFALSAIDLADTGAEREGPIVFKAQYPIPQTMSSVYFYAGIPDQTKLDLPDIRFAAKGEASFGNTELALAGFYSKNDHPRLLLMGTTGTGDFNFFAEAVGKWGSERYFLERGTGANLPGQDFPAPTGAQKADQLWFAGTLGGYYMNTDNNITVSASYFYNGEGQTAVSAREAYVGYYMNPASPENSIKIDTIKFGTHYAGLSFSKTKLFFDELSFSVYGVANLSDQSGLVSPSLSWKFFDYVTAKLGATLTFGAAGSEYPTMLNPSTGKPKMAVSIGFDLGGGAF